MKKKKAGFLPVSVAVLMGGQSRRFGSPKAFLPYKGSSLAAHVLRQAARWSPDVFAVGRQEDQVPPDARKEFRVVTDFLRKEGPLSGLHAALSNCAKPALFLRGVDMPLLNGTLLKWFVNGFKESGHPDAVVPQVQGRWEPLCALWNRNLASRLAEGRWHSFQALLNSRKLRILSVSEEELRAVDPRLDCLRNFNSAHDWKQFLAQENPRKSLAGSKNDVDF